jgi:sulfur carrier protein ThiS
VRDATVTALDGRVAAEHARAVAVLEWTSHLKTHFPALGNGPVALRAETVAEALAELERRTPGIAFYVCDELGRLRRHVNIFVDGEMIMDRQRLSDPLGDESRVFIAQALSGG